MTTLREALEPLQGDGPEFFGRSHCTWCGAEWTGLCAAPDGSDLQECPTCGETAGVYRAASVGAPRNRPSAGEPGGPSPVRQVEVAVEITLHRHRPAA